MKANGSLQKPFPPPTPPSGADWSYPRVGAQASTPFARPMPSYVASESSPKYSEVFGTGSVSGGTYNVVYSVVIAYCTAQYIPLLLPKSSIPHTIFSDTAVTCCHRRSIGSEVVRFGIPEHPPAVSIMRIEWPAGRFDAGACVRELPLGSTIASVYADRKSSLTTRSAARLIVCYSTSNQRERALSALFR